MTAYNEFYDILLKSDYQPLFEKSDLTEDKKYKFKHKNCGTEFTRDLKYDRIPLCPECYNYEKKNYTTELSEFLKKYESNVITNDSNIILPEQKLVIEINYLYHHTDRNGYYKNYFINKKKELADKGYNYFLVMEDEIKDTPNIAKSMCLNKINRNPRRIYARKCKFGKPSKSKMRVFLNENHLQGDMVSKYAYGLYHDHQLVSLITLGCARYNKNYEYEIHRFCSRIGYSIIGGFSKLLKYAIKQLQSRKIITYVDLRHGTGNVYKLSGFEYIGYSNPNYFYVNDYKRQSRVQYQKHKLEKKLGFFDSNLTEWQNMQLNGFDRIWDCGNNVFALPDSLTPAKS